MGHILSQKTTFLEKRYRPFFEECFFKFHSNYTVEKTMTLRKMVITSLIRRESTPKLFLGLEGPMAVILSPTSFFRFLGPHTTLWHHFVVLKSLESHQLQIV